MAVEDSNLSILTQSDAQNIADSLFGGSAQPEAAQSHATSDFQALMAGDSPSLTQSGLQNMMTNSVEIDGVTYEGGIMEYLSTQGIFGNIGFEGGQEGGNFSSNSDSNGNENESGGSSDGSGMDASGGTLV